MTNNEARKVLQEVWRNERTDYESVEVKEAIDRAIRSLEDRPQGKWIDTGEKMENYGKWYRCSNCEHTDYYGNFCPNCGADMRKGCSKE